MGSRAMPAHHTPRSRSMSPADRKQCQGIMANVLAANWNANKLIMTNLAICLVLLLIHGVEESPQLLGDLLTWGGMKPTNQLPMLRVLRELPPEGAHRRC